MTFLSALGFFALGISLSFPRLFEGAVESRGLSSALELKLDFLNDTESESESETAFYKSGKESIINGLFRSLEVVCPSITQPNNIHN